MRGQQSSAAMFFAPYRAMIDPMAALCRLLLVLAVMLAAPRAHATELVYPPGSRLGLAPPSGMMTSTNFFGFEDPDTHAAIILASLPTEAYAELEKTISAEALKRQGVILEKREAMPLSTGKAFLVIGRQEIDKTKVRKWILIGSSPALTALVTVQIPETAKNLYSDAAIRETLGTLAIRAHVPVEEQLGLLPFKLVELAGFQVGGIMPGRAAVLSDAPADTQAQPQPHIFVSVAPGGPAQTSDRDAFARDVFAAIPNVREVRVTSAEPLRISGQPGYQIIAQAKDPAGAASLTVVQWLRFGAGGYLQLVGIARADGWLEAYPRFRAVRDGIEPR
jgi:hypothetical protein